MVMADLGGVAAIEGEILSPWSAKALAEELEIQSAIQLVAEGPDAQIYGWCACRVMWPEAELLKIATKRTKRERGIGRSLLEHLAGQLQKRKVTNLFLEVRSDNHVAVDFYKRHGFHQVGLRARYYTDPADSAMILKKNLS